MAFDSLFSSFFGVLDFIPVYIWGTCGLLLFAACFGLYLRTRFIESQPNEWLLIIRDGKMVKAGVGLKTFLGLTDSFVKFPSKVSQVQFSANNVTKEMQGVDIQGFAFWSVYRDEDGPFRCYKYMQGGDPNHNVKAMCESVLRNLIANSSLEQVLRNRSHLRDNIRGQLKDQFKGWGIWLETVEITEVKILSKKLFEDLQAEFRQDAHLKASKIEMDSKEKIETMKQESEMKMTLAAELNETKKMATRNTERIKRDQQGAEYANKKNELELIRLDRESKFQIEKMKKEFEQEKEKIQNEQAASNMKIDFELEISRKRLNLEKEHNEISLAKYQIDSTERIYNKIGVKELKINQFTGDMKTNLCSLLPAMASGLIPFKE